MTISWDEAWYLVQTYALVGGGFYGAIAIGTAIFWEVPASKAVRMELEAAKQEIERLKEREGSLMQIAAQAVSLQTRLTSGQSDGERPAPPPGKVDQ